MSYIYQMLFHILKYSASICLNSNRIQFQGIGYSSHACGRFNKVDFYKPLMVSPLWRTYLWCMYLIFSAFMPPRSLNSNAAFNRLYALLHASARLHAACSLLIKSQSYIASYTTEDEMRQWPREECLHIQAPSEMRGRDSGNSTQNNHQT